jgi:hypothetical protein
MLRNNYSIGISFIEFQMYWDIVLATAISSTNALELEHV